MSILFNNGPIHIINPELAAIIGRNEAAILQQTHYWIDITRNKNLIDGVPWVYNTYEQWQEQFSYLSEITIRRAIKSLEKMGLLISKQFGKGEYNRTKWYTIDYAKLKELEQKIEAARIAKLAEKPRPNYVKKVERILEIPQQGTTQQTSQKEEKTARKPTVFRTDQNDRIEPIKMIASYKHILPTKINPSLSSKIEVQKPASKQTEKQKITEGIIKVWEKEIGELGVRISDSLRVRLYWAYQTLFNSNLDGWQQYCRLIASSKFLRGEADNRYFKKVWIVWAINPQNYEKVRGGEYNFGDRANHLDKQISSEELDLKHLLDQKQQLEKQLEYRREDLQKQRKSQIEQHIEALSEEENQSLREEFATETLNQESLFAAEFRELGWKTPHVKLMYGSYLRQKLTDTLFSTTIGEEFDQDPIKKRVEQDLSELDKKLLALQAGIQNLKADRPVFGRGEGGATAVSEQRSQVDKRLETENGIQISSGWQVKPARKPFTHEKYSRGNWAQKDPNGDFKTHRLGRGIEISVAANFLENLPENSIENDCVA